MPQAETQELPLFKEETSKEVTVNVTSGHSGTGRQKIFVETQKGFSR